MTMWTKEQLRVVASSKGVLIPLASLLSASLGSAAGYRFAMSKLEEKYARRADDEIAAAKEYYRRLNKAEEFATPSAAVEALGAADDEDDPVPPDMETVADVLRSYQGVEQTNYAAISEETVNIFTEGETVEIHPDTEERSSDAPYIITQEEWTLNEPDHGQQTITYYEGDDTLADERDMPIDDTNGTVGDDNLTRFGHGSGDQNTVLVRNERLGMDYEVVLSKGKYSVEVAGLTDEDERGKSPRRVRDNDD